MLVDPYRLNTNFFERLLGILPSMELFNVEIAAIMERPIEVQKVEVKL